MKHILITLLSVILFPTLEAASINGVYHGALKARGVTNYNAPCQVVFRETRSSWKISISHVSNGFLVREDITYSFNGKVKGKQFINGQLTATESGRWTQRANGPLKSTVTVRSSIIGSFKSRGTLSVYTSGKITMTGRTPYVSLTLKVRK